MSHYILNGKTPVPADLMTWAKWLEASRDERVVAKTKVGTSLISTVFLGLDHQYGDGPPLLFETLVFEGQNDGDMWRCSTWEEAEKQHADAVELVKKSMS